MAKKHILVVEDERDINELVQYNLDKEGFRTTACYNGEDALDAIKNGPPDLIILDLMLPSIDGLEVCRLIKQDVKTKNIPIIMLTAKSEEPDVIVGLRMGADDYVVKPFSPKILLARINAVLRRVSTTLESEQVRRIENLVIDIPKHKVTVKEKKIELTNLEFNILEFLSRYPGRAFSRDQIMDNAWKEGKFIIDRSVDVHIRGLRKKMGKAADMVETVRGVGYKFKEID